jgi:hypothetical protein
MQLNLPHEEESMNSLVINESVVSNDVKCPYIEKEVDMGFFKNFIKDGQHIYAGCPCKCTCNCNRCGFLPA